MIRGRLWACTHGNAEVIQGKLRSRACSSKGAWGVLPVSDAWALGKSARANEGGARDDFNWRTRTFGRVDVIQICFGPVYAFVKIC